MEDISPLSQLHIDAARNSTDDFNPFHDPYKWDRIQSNPFGSPIALRFQLEALAAHQVELRRAANGEAELLAGHGLGFSNYQFSFADVVRPGEQIEVEVRPSSNKIDAAGEISNRVSLRKGRKLVILGSQRESRRPLVASTVDISQIGDLAGIPDRSYLPGDRVFLKRKYMNTSNAKNFLVGSMVDQHYYFDELEGRARFPALFPVALLSCALLEKAWHEGYDFYRRPMVYTSHAISLDRTLLSELKSNDCLHILVRGPEKVEGRKGLGRSALPQTRYDCLGLVDGNGVLFGAQVTMALLEHVVAAAGAKSGE